MSKRVWGDIIYTDVDEEDKEDEIVILSEKAKTLRDEKIIPNENESWENAKERRKKEIMDIEKKIWDIIYFRRQKKMGT